MNFDEMIDRRGTGCAKWDAMEQAYGVSPEDGIAMWVADMDFRPPRVVQDSLHGLLDHGVYGYPGPDDAYRDAITWWMQERHGWQVDPSWIFTTHGLVNGTAMCIDTWTEPGDGVVLFTPVYHAFARVIRSAGREVVECPLVRNHDRYEMDFDAYDAMMTGREKMVMLCSPHNPGGRCWTEAELKGLAAFAERHDLILVSDEIHADLVMPGHRHIAFDTVDHGIRDRLVMMTAATKTFNIAGAHIGNVIIPDPALRKAFGQRMAGLGMSPGLFGLRMVTAAYSPQGAEWVNALCEYLDGNRRILDAAVDEIPGVHSMRLEATYLSWVDFEGTGMSHREVLDRIEGQAKIAVNHGPTFGKGGEEFLRFNIATQRVRVVEAAERLKAAFSDLQ
ncbi:Cystathionine beta-lyase PatB [Roseivivax sp. THAF40]|uniref:MalY/PatB family protein n=1 Tax=unclassified Roseivivax TaxID=2639302 RepID=UPI00126858DD|nr:MULTISPECIES: MalY/PatB family protein [unclassified Roseivivax]QFS84523.1 Cystathionine beta-lyase PatB [Roseivivax sp. THAF197b]QFT48351.1 Cystathionine beta-lyase PatB [Roseivivax sp. THAF40]